jgi:hypothetical protein
MIIFSSNDEAMDELLVLPTSFQMFIFAELTENHHNVVFPEDFDTILSLFARREKHNLLYQS